MRRQRTTDSLTRIHEGCPCCRQEETRVLVKTGRVFFSDGRLLRHVHHQPGHNISGARRGKHRPLGRSRRNLPYKYLSWRKAVELRLGVLQLIMQAKPGALQKTTRLTLCLQHGRCKNTLLLEPATPPPQLPRVWGQKQDGGKTGDANTWPRLPPPTWGGR